MKPRYKPESCPNCEYDRRFPGYESGGWIRQDNNGPIVSCPLCNPDGTHPTDLESKEKSMNTLRLQHLIEILKRVETQKLPFDMGLWFDHPDDCGTAACAMGWACRDKEFREAGLHTFKMEPIYRGHFGFLAAAAFFSISRHTASYLFDESSYEGEGRIAGITPAMVINHIEQVLSGEFNGDE